MLFGLDEKRTTTPFTYLALQTTKWMKWDDVILFWKWQQCQIRLNWNKWVAKKNCLHYKYINTTLVMALHKHIISGFVSNTKHW